MVGNPIHRGHEILLALGVVLVAGMVGAMLPLFIDKADDSVFRLAVLPGAVVLGFLFLFNRPLLFLLILFFRAACDPIFEAMRDGGEAIGLGAVCNALMILIAFLFLVEQPRAVSRTAVPMWAPMLAVAAVAALRAPDLGPAIRALLIYVSYAAVFSIPFFLKGRMADLRWLLPLVLLSSVVSVLYGYVDLATAACGRPDGRICSTFSHPNILAFYLVLMLSLGLYLLKSPMFRLSLLQRFLVGAYMLALIPLLLATGTRSAWAACLVIFAVYGLLFERRFLVYMVVGAGLLLLVPAVQDRLLDLTRGNEQVLFGRLNSYAWRKFIWEAGLGWMKPADLPFGYGLESFRYYAPVFFPAGGAMQAGAHSVYVQWLFEAGIVGVACSAWLFWRLFSMLARGFGQDRVGATIVVTIVIEYLVMSYSDNMLAYLSFNWTFWFVMGAACAAWASRAPAEQTSRSAQPNQPSSKASTMGVVHV